MLKQEYQEAISEVLALLEQINETEKIPLKFIEFLHENKDLNYQPYFDPRQKINELVLTEKTKDLLAVIYLNYWCEGNEKKWYERLIIKNEIVQRRKDNC